MLTTVSVTNEHIANGMRDSTTFCALGLAIREVVKPHCAVRVDRGWIRFIDTDDPNLPEQRRVLLPKARAWQDAIDRGERAVPTLFALDVPYEFLANSLKRTYDGNANWRRRS